MKSQLAVTVNDIGQEIMTRAPLIIYFYRVDLYYCIIT